jgi:uncharacterized protein
MSSQTAQPSGTRIEAIDILRGFTLLGIIIVHMVEQYYAGQWPETVTKTMPQSIGDQIIQSFSGIFISGKFYMIFSFLFGLSFFIQFSKSDTDKKFLIRFIWRLVILFIIGSIHHLHYRGDILTIYAILGIGLLLFYRLPDRYLFWLAALLILDIPAFVTRGVNAFLFSESSGFPSTDQTTLETYFNTLKSGSYPEILKANYYEFKGKMQFQVISGRLYITLGLFLLGVYAGRKRFFENLSEKIKVFRKIIRYALFSILGCIVLGAAVFGGAHLLKITVPDGVAWMVGGFIYDLFNAALASIYVCWILILLQKEKWQKRFHYFYPVGRMGLTTYLMQTFFGTLIFFSYGLGLVGDLGALMCFGLALVLFVFQIVFAKVWFRYFTYGPIEWLWRNLTYLKIHRMRSETEKTVVV